MSHYFIEFNYNKMTIKLNPQIHMANMQKKTKNKNKTILLFKNHAIDDEKINEMHHLINKFKEEGALLLSRTCFLGKYSFW